MLQKSKLNISSFDYNQNYGQFYSVNNLGISNYFGYGVNIANAVSSSRFSSQNMSINQISESIMYRHNITVEIYNKFIKYEKLIWKGEAIWESPSLEIRNGAQIAFQILFSNLPSDPDYRVIIPEVKESHRNNFYRQYCYERWFACPALPFRIRFDDIAYQGASRISTNAKIPSSIVNPETLSAYVDLIQTAEYALPLGSKNWENPTDEYLWSKAKLGGLYYLGSNNKPVNILIDLKGSSTGYVIDKCWIATDEEFSKFQHDIDRWRANLINYFDFYK